MILSYEAVSHMVVLQLNEYRKSLLSPFSSHLWDGGWARSHVPPGDYTLEAGLEVLSARTRLPATDGSGNPVPKDAVLLGGFEVQN